MIISDVLFVPSFKFNLLSIPILTQTSQCIVTFYPSHCIFQDPLTKMEIGRGHKRGGLYFLDGNSNVMALLTTTTSTTWHARLGHPSSTVLQSLAPILGFNNTFSTSCDICQLSKQTRLPFPTHHSSSLNCFDLIHVDLWGKYATPTRNGHCYFLTIVG